MRRGTSRLYRGRAAQSGARIGGGVLDTQARNWAATAMAVRWSRRASLECLRTKAEVKANAIKRIKVTAARPWLETGSRSPEALVCLGPVSYTHLTLPTSDLV